MSYVCNHRCNSQFIHHVYQLFILNVRCLAVAVIRPGRPCVHPDLVRAHCNCLRNSRDSYADLSNSRSDDAIFTCKAVSFPMPWATDIH